MLSWTAGYACCQVTPAGVTGLPTTLFSVCAKQAPSCWPPACMHTPQWLQAGRGCGVIAPGASPQTGRTAQCDDTLHQPGSFGSGVRLVYTHHPAPFYVVLIRLPGCVPPHGCSALAGPCRSPPATPCCSLPGLQQWPGLWTHARGHVHPPVGLQHQRHRCLRAAVLLAAGHLCWCAPPPAAARAAGCGVVGSSLAARWPPLHCCVPQRAGAGVVPAGGGGTAGVWVGCTWHQLAFISGWGAGPLAPPDSTRMKMPLWSHA